MLTLEKFPGVRIITGGTFDDPNWIKIVARLDRSAEHGWCFRRMWIALRKALRKLEQPHELDL